MKTILQTSTLLFILLFTQTQFANIFKGAEYRTNLSYTYGRFEVRMKSSYREGMLSSFFTYYDGGGGIGNWNEIDIEIMGRYFDNVQFNTITPNQTNHVAHKPVLDSPHRDFHIYAFEWTPDYVAWFIDDVEVLKQTGEHIQTLTLPQKIMMNIWPPLFENWAGEFYPDALPAFAFYDWVSYYAYTPGGGNYGTENNFTHDWTDNFDYWDTDRWDKATHTFNGNGCDFVQENAVFQDGNLILCLTNDTNLGYTDIQAPALMWARASSGQVLVMFSEELDKATAETISNYVIQDVTINSATLRPDLKSVELSVSGLPIPSTKTLVVFTMKDDASIPNVMSAKATPIIMPQILSYPIKINCAGPSELDYLADREWAKDKEFGFLDGNSRNYPSLQISGTDEDLIFQSEKFGMVTYMIRVPNGSYNVKLMFAENYFESVGKRIFDIYLEQNRVLSNLDIYSLVGKNAACNKNFTDIQVNDGILDIQFAEKIDNALLNGIVITPSTTGLDNENGKGLDEFRIEQNYPNPFNGNTIIKYSLSLPANLDFRIYNILGEQIFFKDLGYVQSGNHQLNLNTISISDNALPAGVYIYSFTVSNKQYAKKFVLLN